MDGKPRFRNDITFKIPIGALCPNGIWSNGIVVSCISCDHFNEQTEFCAKANARPPARIIAFGCDAHSDKDDVPF